MVIFVKDGYTRYLYLYLYYDLLENSNLMITANNYVFDNFLIASFLTGYMPCPGNCPDGRVGGYG